MESKYFDFIMQDDVKIIFSPPERDNVPTTNTYTLDISTSTDSATSAVNPRSVFSPLAAPFQSRFNRDMSMISPQEPHVGDAAPSSLNTDVLVNMRANISDTLFEDQTEKNAQAYVMGSRSESVTSSGNIWSEGSPPSTSTNTSNTTNNLNKNEILDNFEFFLKTLSAANAYAAMLTREQTMVLQNISPTVMFEFLQEVVRIRSEKRMQRAQSNECAFCKNNGENEENYSSHVLKDWKGRVKCPVLRAFRCPNCGATGDYAHTIKYCRIIDNERDRTSSSPRRRLPSGSLVFVENNSPNNAPPTTPAQSPTTFNSASCWSNFRN